MHRENLPLHGLHVHAKSVLFRVSYCESRIDLEVSHIVSDGRGTPELLQGPPAPRRRTLRRGRRRPPVRRLRPPEVEDSFISSTNHALAAPTRRRCTGSRLARRGDPTFLEATCPPAACSTSHDYGVNLTALVIAVVMRHPRRDAPSRPAARHPHGHPGRPALFKSTTVKNFFGLAFVSYVPGDETSPWTSWRAPCTRSSRPPRGPTSSVAHEPHDQAREEPLLRCQAAVREGRLSSWPTTSPRDVTTTVSNLGSIASTRR